MSFAGRDGRQVQMARPAKRGAGSAPSSMAIVRLVRDEVLDRLLDRGFTVGELVRLGPRVGRSFALTRQQIHSRVSRLREAKGAAGDAEAE